MLNMWLPRLSTVAAMPDSIDFGTAAALPTAGSTALQIISDVGEAKAGMTILIHDAAGGVGSYASQIAKHLGARVIGTASGADISYLNSVGIGEVIDYERERSKRKSAEPIRWLISWVATRSRALTPWSRRRRARDHRSADRRIGREVGGDPWRSRRDEAQRSRSGRTREAR